MVEVDLPQIDENASNKQAWRADVQVDKQKFQSKIELDISKVKEGT